MIIFQDGASKEVIAELFTIASTWKQSKCSPIDEWLKQYYTYIVDYYSAIKGMKYCHLQQLGWT